MKKTKSNTSNPFLWGVATSAHQIEGFQKNNWTAWESEGFIDGGIQSGPATKHLHLFKDDINLMKELNVNSYRFSVEWSRLEPEKGRWNQEAEDWYMELISLCESLKIYPMVTLHHFTVPQWFAQEGGFSSPDAHLHFKSFVEKLCERIGPRIPLWCTINEPLVFIIGSYLAGFMPPGVFSPEKAQESYVQLLKSHVLAYDVLHSKLKGNRQGYSKNYPLQVGTAHNMLHFQPDRIWHPLEWFFCRQFHQIYNMAWIEAVMGRAQKFKLPWLVKRAPLVKEALGRCTADFIGINYYTKGLVQWRPRQLHQQFMKSVPIGFRFARPTDMKSEMEWAVHPQGLRAVLMSLKRFHKPIVITENGIADKYDKLRPKFIVDHLKEIAFARERGVNVQGYYHWSLLDNFEWIKGYFPRFGLYQVKYKTFQRLTRPSAKLYAHVIETHERKNPPTRETLKAVL